MNKHAAINTFLTVAALSLMAIAIAAALLIAPIATMIGGCVVMLGVLVKMVYDIELGKDME